jgi:hypothetical protein
MPPEVARPRIIDLIEGVRRRRTLVAITSAAAVGSELTSIVAWVSWASLDAVTTLILSMVVGVIAAAFLLSRRRIGRTTAAAARAIERARPEVRNLAVTAEELWRHPDRASPWMTARVMGDASRAVEGLTLRDVVAGKSAILSTTIALLVTVGIWFIPNARQVQGAISEAAQSAVSGVAGSKLTVSVKPPPYAGLQDQTLNNPEQIDVLEGSRLEFSLAEGRTVRLRFGATGIATLSPPAGKAEVVARDSGYFAIEEEGGPTRLIALSVTRDHSPSVKIEQPARDLLLPEAKRSLPIKITASDDLALTSLELRYTKVSGSGEQFEFVEGALPVRVTRESGRQWRADAQMALASLNLAAGDSLVYRAVARDGRPGDAGLGASDTFFIEIAGPGQVPFEGVEMPPEEERYALSQQMVVLKIERLRAREKGMTREAVVEESALLAAEQRSVRANFIFLLGGHVEDEEVEAEQSSEIAEGRLQNTARRDITLAIGHMTRAEQGLVAASTSGALPPARAAVEALQRAFGRSRYLLRALASRTPLDPARRLTGDLANVDTWRRPPPPGEPREGEAARAVLAELIAAYDALSSGATSGPDLGRVAERALAIDPASSRWQQIARGLQAAHRAHGRPAEVKKILDEVIQQVASDAGAGLVPAAGVPLPQSPLERAWRGGTRR